MNEGGAPQAGQWIRIGDLQLAMTEGQEILTALHGGEVDGIVIEGAGGPRVYTLKGADDSFRLMMERMSEGAMLLSPEGAILYCNGQCAALLDSPMERVLGSDLADYAAAHHAARITRLLGAALQGRDAKAELSLKRNSGPALPARLSVSRMDLEGAPALCAVLSDLSEQKRTAAALRRLEHQAAAGRMAAQVAHEINNPLAGVKNAFQLVKADLPPNHKYAAYVPRIEQEIERIARIVRQMFDVCRPAEEDELQPLGRILADVAALQELAIEKQDVHIEAQMVPECASVMLPGHALRHILYNLLRNAIEVSPEGGVVRLAVSAVSAQQVELCIIDEGPGIPEDVRPHIFEPFFTTKKASQTSGMGLGLSICRSLATELGGTLDFRTAPGRGSTFILRLPLQGKPISPA